MLACKLISPFHTVYFDLGWTPPNIRQKLETVRLWYHIINSPDYRLFIYLGFYVALNTVQVISRQVVGRAEETSTYSWPRFCTVNCRPMASNYQLSHLRPCREPNTGLRGGRRECYHSATVAPIIDYQSVYLQ